MLPKSLASVRGEVLRSGRSSAVGTTAPPPRRGGGLGGSRSPRSAPLPGENEPSGLLPLLISKSMLLGLQLGAGWGGECQSRAAWAGQRGRWCGAGRGRCCERDRTGRGASGHAPQPGDSTCAGLHPARTWGVGAARQVVWYWGNRSNSKQSGGRGVRQGQPHGREALCSSWGQESGWSWPRSSPLGSGTAVPRCLLAALLHRASLT